MSVPAPKLVMGRHLRVAVHASDNLRRAALLRMVTQAGHEVVALIDAHVVLADGEVAIDKTAIVTLGAEDNEQAGSLPRDATAEQIDAALLAVAAGLTVRAASERTDGFGALRKRSVHTLLTPRELEILAAISSGLSNKAIARRFDISLHTVKFHVESLFKKLGVRTRAEAVARAMQRRRDETVEL